MRKLSFLFAGLLVLGSAVAQTSPPAPIPPMAPAVKPPPEPAPPMVPEVKPPLGAASRASRHEWQALERRQRVADKAEDRADAQRRQRPLDRAGDLLSPSR